MLSNLVNNTVCVLTSLIMLVIIGILSSGCLNTGGDTRWATEEERVAVDTLRNSFEESRGLVECPELEEVLVLTTDFETTQDRCAASAPVHACVYVVNRHVFDIPGSSFIIINEELVGTESYWRVLMHEAAHVERACWTARGEGDYTSRINYGETDDCQITSGSDSRHCDSELWITVLGEAWDTFKRDE